MAIPTNRSRRSHHRMRRLALGSLALALTGSLFAVSVVVGIAAAQDADGTWFRCPP